MKIIDQIKFKLAGRAVPVMRVSEVDPRDGRVMTLRDLGTCRDDPNRLVYSWDNKAWEKSKDATPITRMSTSGIPAMCWIVSERGETINLYAQPWKGPALETVLGNLANIDVVADAMDLNPSMRDKIIFLIIGIFLGWLIIGPVMSGIMS